MSKVPTGMTLTSARENAGDVGQKTDHIQLHGRSYAESAPTVAAFESVLGNAFARAEKRVFAVRAGGEKKLAILSFAFLESGGKLTDAERFF